MTGRLPFPLAARSLLRDSVLAAVDELIRERGWAATTMADVAAAAGVSRQTLYNEFGSRSALVEAYVGREIESLVRSVSDSVRGHADDAHEALRSAFELFLRLASDEPVVRLIARSDGGTGAAAPEQGELMGMLTTLGQTLAQNHLAALIAEVWPQVAAADATLLAGSLARLAISHALVPTVAGHTEDAAEVAAGVGRMLAPFVDQVLAT
jgi:AcrR family transcriptional regulator